MQKSAAVTAQRYRSLALLCHTFLEIEHAWINFSLVSQRTARLHGTLDNCAGGVGPVVTCRTEFRTS
jgi:hypothetical protein